MNSIRMKHALSYLRGEILKLSLFLALLYGSIFGILHQPINTPSPLALSPQESISLPLQVEQNDNIYIPTLNVSAPLLVVYSSNPQEFIEPLKQGVTLFPSVLPGKNGTAIILGHSAPLGWPHINYDWVFSDLQKLSSKDIISISFNGREYIYKVEEIIMLQRGESIPDQYLSKDTSHILLISCWPPGIDNKRIGVYARQIIDKI